MKGYDLPWTPFPNHELFDCPVTHCKWNKPHKTLSVKYYAIGGLAMRLVRKGRQCNWVLTFHNYLQALHGFSCGWYCSSLIRALCLPCSLPSAFPSLSRLEVLPPFLAAFSSSVAFSAAANLISMASILLIASSLTRLLSILAFSSMQLSSV